MKQHRLYGVELGRLSITLLLMLMISTLGTSCPRRDNPLRGARVPSISDVAPGTDPVQGPWTADDASKFLTARITNIAESAQNVRVTIKMSRHRPWNGSNESREWVVPNVFVVADDDPETKIFSCRFAPPHPEDFRLTQAVFYKWFVIATHTDGSDLVLAETPLRSLRIGGFTPADTDAALVAARAAIASSVGFDRDFLFQDPITKGFIPTHPAGGVSRCYEKMGSAYAYPCSIHHTCPNTLTDPSLLLLEVGGSSNNPTWAFAGWAYAAHHDGTLVSHPILPPIPWEAWFIHEAGFHEPDGGFTPTPPPNDTPRGSAHAQRNPAPPHWHGRKWDLHVFMPRGAATPLIDIGDPRLVSGGGCVSWDTTAFFYALDLDVQPRP